MADTYTFDRWGRMFYHPEMHPNHGTPWTNTDQRYLIDHYDRQGPEEISLALGRTIKTVQAKACALRKKGLMPPSRYKKFKRTLRPRRRGRHAED